jgi:quercetin dioxygenase-like cupin family protein
MDGKGTIGSCLHNTETNTEATFTMMKLSGPVCILAILLSQSTSATDSELPGALEAGWQGKKVCELLQEDDKIRVLRCTFPPGVGHERHYHPAHFGYTLKGSTMHITDATGEREISASADGTWQSNGVAWHEVVNVGDTTSQYLIVEQKY